jgi:uncharacterized tellurite resistance protein B-like protein
MTDFTALRFNEEENLVRILEEDFGLNVYYEIFDTEKGVNSWANRLLADNVLLNEVIAPRLYQICKEVKSKLNFQEEIEFYITQAAHLNAFAINGFGYRAHMICFTSGLIQCLNDDELAYVIGHEIGHLMFKHSQLNTVAGILANSDEPVSSQIRNLFSRWDKYAEISADRMGYLAQPNLETVGKTFFKLASGLSEEHLKFNITEYMKQLDKIKDLSRDELISSHPKNLVRLKCLELFSKSELYSASIISAMTKDQLQEEMATVLNLEEYHPTEEWQSKALEFIASAGMYIASIDNKMNPNEWETLYSMVYYHTSQPEKYLTFKDASEIEERKNAICGYYALSKNDHKFKLCEMVVDIATCDGKLDEKERVALFEIANKLNIDDETMKRMIQQASRNISHTPGQIVSGVEMDVFLKQMMSKKR